MASVSETIKALDLIDHHLFDIECHVHGWKGEMLAGDSSVPTRYAEDIATKIEAIEKVLVFIRAELIIASFYLREDVPFRTAWEESAKCLLVEEEVSWLIDLMTRDYEGAVRKDFEKARIPVRTDFHALRMVTKVMIANAIKATAARSESYNEMAQPCIAIAAEINATTLFVTVSDNGVGIQSEDVEGVLNGSRRLFEKGHGTGFQVARSYAEMAVNSGRSGNFAYRPPPLLGAGATFCFSCDVALEEPARSPK